MSNTPQIVISATASGVGKTTITLALLRLLQRAGESPVSFKCGPDYIDPAFHHKVLGVDSLNLDPYFCNAQQLRALVDTHVKPGDIGVIEGVMGYYDGLGATTDCSTYSVAKAIGAGVILIVDARGQAASSAAVISGFMNFASDNQIAGVIFSSCKPMMYPFYKKIAESVGVRSYGYMPVVEGASLESRHLGLVGAQEVYDLSIKIDMLADAAATSLDFEGLVTLARDGCMLGEEATGLPISSDLSDTCLAEDIRPVIAVARDDAFCFTYPTTLELFEQLGGTVQFFSPLYDKELPKNTAGLYLPGGYPELHLEELSENKEMRDCIAKAIHEGVPTIAECGGFMYLHDAIDGVPMAGVITTTCENKGRLVRFGYVEVEATSSSLLAEAGESIRGHEFHYWDSDNPGGDCRVTRGSTGKNYTAAYTSDTLYAGYPHLYLPSTPKAAQRFIKKGSEYARDHFSN